MPPKQSVRVKKTHTKKLTYECVCSAQFEQLKIWRWDNSKKTNRKCVSHILKHITSSHINCVEYFWKVEKIYKNKRWNVRKQPQQVANYRRRSASYNICVLRQFQIEFLVYKQFDESHTQTIWNRKNKHTKRRRVHKVQLIIASLLWITRFQTVQLMPTSLRRCLSDVSMIIVRATNSGERAWREEYLKYVHHICCLIVIYRVLK